MGKHKFIQVLLSVLCLTIFVGCGSGEDRTSNRTGRDFYVIETVEQSLPTPGDGSDWRCLGMQFEDGKVLQIWGQNVKNEQLQASLDVYLYHGDGTGEFLYGGVNNKYRSGWYRDDEGYCFVLLGNTLIKVGKDGTNLYSRTYDGRTFLNMYRDEKGKWMVLSKTEENKLLVSELNRENGDLMERGAFTLGDGFWYVSGQEDGIYLLNTQGAWKLNFETDTKEILVSFAEQYYTFEYVPVNFELTEENAIRLLQPGKVISLNQVNMAQFREVVILSGCQQITEIEECIEKFNAQQDTYFVAWEMLRDEQTVTEYKDKKAIELGTGAGPDLMLVGSTASPGNIWGYVQKGVFERLNPYMEQSGVKEEDFFSVAFSGLRDGEDIYGISVCHQFGGSWVSADVLGSTGTPTLEEFLDALLAYDKPAVLFAKAESNTVLNVLLRGSDTVVGAIDWENGTCDFSGELFAKVLQVAKRYGDDRTLEKEALGDNLGIQGLYSYTMREEQIGLGRVPVWGFFDDGCYPAYNIMYTLAINSNAVCKDGAWTFLEYLLTGDLQSMRNFGRFPVKRSGFEELVSKELEEGALLFTIDGEGIPRDIVAKAGLGDYENRWDVVRDAENYKARYDLTEEKVEEIRQLMECARTYPVHTQEILSIIFSEAGAYFEDDKTLEEVVAIIQNRVQLYLDERN